MRPSFFLLPVFLLIVCSRALAQNPDPNTAKYREAGVKSVKLYEYRYRHDKVKGSGKLFSAETYDTLGREIESFTYIMGEMRQLYEYNEQGDVSEETAYVIKHSSPLVTAFFYTYDDQGRMTSKKSDREFSEEWEYVYDVSGNLVQTKWYFYGQDEHPENYFMDSLFYENSLLVRKTRWHPSSGSYFQMAYTYDAAGHLIEESRYERGRITDTWTRTYDANGNEIRSVYTGFSDDTHSDGQSVYNEKGLVTETHSTSTDERKGTCIKYVYEYYGSE